MIKYPVDVDSLTSFKDKTVNVFIFLLVII